MSTSCTFDERDTHESSSLSILDVHSRFVIVGLPAEPLSGFNAVSLPSNDSFIGGSHMESKNECLQILPLAADKGAKPWITLLPISDTKKAVEAVKRNDLKGKYQLVFDAGFEGGGEVEDKECTSRCMYEFERLSYSIVLVRYGQKGRMDFKRNPLTMCILCSQSPTLPNRLLYHFELPVYHRHTKISQRYHFRKVKNGDHPFS
jgi:hypothetical protein